MDYVTLSLANDKKETSQTKIHDDRCEVFFEEHIGCLDVPVSQGMRLGRVHAQSGLTNPPEGSENHSLVEDVHKINTNKCQTTILSTMTRIHETLISF